MDERRHEEAFESPSRRFAFEESDAESLKAESTIVKANFLRIALKPARVNRRFFAGEPAKTKNPPFKKPSK